LDRVTHTHDPGYRLPFFFSAQLKPKDVLKQILSISSGEMILSMIAGPYNRRASITRHWESRSST